MDLQSINLALGHKILDNFSRIFSYVPGGTVALFQMKMMPVNILI